MAEVITLQLNVKGKEAIDQLTTGLDELGVSYSVVERGAQKASKETASVAKYRKIFRELDEYTAGWASKLFEAGEGLREVVKGLNLSKAALISTGIGALVVALGLIVAYWDDIVDYITGANKKLQEQIDLLKSQSSILDAEYKVLDEQQKLLEKQGEATDTIIEKKKLLLQTQLGILGAELALLQTQNSRIENQAKELTFWEKLSDLAARSASRGRRARTTGTVTTEEQIAINQGRQAEAELRARIAELQLTLENLINPDPKKLKKGERQKKVNPLTGEDVDAETERISKHFTDLFELDKANKDALQESTDNALDRLVTSEEYAQAQRIKAEEEGAKVRMRISKEEAEAKMQDYMLAANGFAAASALIGQETAAGKAFAVAGTLISTYAAAQKAYESQLTLTPDSPIRAALAAATAVAQGLARVRAILRIQIPGGGGAGAVTGGPTAPAFNVVQESGQNQLNSALISQSRSPIQAFITEGDIETSKELRRKKLAAISF